MMDAKTKLFGLLGNPVGHSMSPFMHNIFLEQCQINGAYLAFAVEQAQIGTAVQGMHALGVQGCNVTIPHKEAVIPYLCGMSEAAEACGAVNTLIYRPEGYYGDNTDGSGLLAALEAKHQWQAAGQNILLVGAGGAAKGVSVAMALEGAAKICIANRSAEKAEQLAEQIGKISTAKTEAIALTELEDAELYQQYSTIVNTTSLGMTPHVDDMIPICIKALQPHHLVVDLIYNPLETKLLRSASKQGAKTASGLGMFIYQGVLSFAAWTGVRPDTSQIEQRLIEKLSGKQ